MKYIYLAVFGLIVLYGASCSIHGSFQGLYGYQHKVAKESPGLIRQPQGPVCALARADTPAVYAINGKDLKDCITPLDRALVYFWAPKCHGYICVPPQYVQAICAEYNVELFVVAEYYDSEIMKRKYAINRPMLGIDCDHYHTDLTAKYSERFFTDLLGSPQDSYTKFYLFRKGQLIDTAASLDRIAFADF